MQKRILVWGLSNNRAGTEAVIANYVNCSKDITFDFLCYENPSINYSFLFENTNNRWFVIPTKIKNPLRYQKKLKQFFNEHGEEYIAVWANLNDISNIDVLKMAKKYRIKNRIAHAHNSSIPNVMVTRLFQRINRVAFDELVTERWACSQRAGLFFYQDKSFKVVANRVDRSKMTLDIRKRNRIREQYDLQNKLVIGSVGRLTETKNLSYLINLLPDLILRNPNIVFLSIGEGEAKDALLDQAKKIGIDRYVIFAGSQKDVQGYLSAMDVYVMPSLFEGIPLSLLEAQFNGLPCICSDAVDEEAQFASETYFVSLADTKRWIELLLNVNRSCVTLNEKRSNLFDLKYAKKTAQEMFEFMNLNK